MLAGQRAGLRLCAVAETETGGLSAHEGILASGRLPCDAPAVGVDAGIVRRENTQALVLIEEVVPEERDRKRDRRAADEEPVEPDARHDQHNGKNGAEHDRRAEVLGGEHQQYECVAEMDDKLKNGEHRVEVLIFLQIGYLLGHQHDKHDLDDLRRLNADAEKAQPAGVAGIARNAERDEQQKEERLKAEQELPAACNDAHVENGQNIVEEKTEDKRKDLDRHERVQRIRLRGAADERDAEACAYAAHDEQEHIALFEEVRGTAPYILDDRRNADFFESFQHGGTSPYTYNFNLFYHNIVFSATGRKRSLLRQMLGV